MLVILPRSLKRSESIKNMDVEKIEGKELRKVSIITPVYNGEEFLEGCMQMLLSQSYPAIDFIFVDDGSTDRSAEIIESYREKDSRIRFFRQEKNIGNAECRNFGLTQVNTSHCMMVDVDDVIPQDYVEKIMKALQEAEKIECDTVHWTFHTIYKENPERTVNRVFKLSPRKVFKDKESKDDFINTLFVSYEDLYRWFSSGKGYHEEVHSRKEMAPYWRYLYSIEVIRNNGIKIFGRRGGDVVFIAKYLLCCKGVYFTDEIQYGYVFRENSVSHQPFAMTYKYAHMEWVESIAEYVPKEEREFFWHRFGGQHLLIIMNTARGCIKTYGFFDGFRQWKEMVRKPLCRKYIDGFDLKKSKFPYSIAIGLLQFKMYFAFYAALYIVLKTGRNPIP